MFGPSHSISNKALPKPFNDIKSDFMKSPFVMKKGLLWCSTSSYIGK